jgi:metal-dependent hydrolase (beta-lactamase superfamily II)
MNSSWFGLATRTIARKLKTVVGGLFDAHAFQLRSWKALQPLEYLDAKIFRSGHGLAKRRHFFIERAMIERFQYLAFHKAIPVAGSISPETRISTT